MQIDFSRGKWDLQDITYAYTYRFEEKPVFQQLDDCIENQDAPEFRQRYDNITLLTREKYTAGTRISARCAYDVFGAPLIVIAKELFDDPDGTKRFGDYFEIVIYEAGINVWQMYYRDGNVTWDYMMSVEFPVTAKEIHTLTVEILEQKLVIYADDHKMMLHVKDLYPSYHVGINACEGINRFYSMSVEKMEE